MRKKRILIFNDCFYMGGTEILLVNLLNHLIDKGCDVTLLLPNPSDRNVLLPRVSSEVPVKYIFSEIQTGLKRWVYKNMLIFFPRLFARKIELRESDYDEVLCFKDGFYSIMFSRLNLPKFLWIQNHPFRRDYVGKSVKEWFAFKLNKLQIDRMTASFDRFDRVICVSDTSRRDYIDIYHGGTPKREIEVLYNALDLSGIEKRAEEPINLPIPEGVAFIVVIRLSYEKTVERVIFAAERLKSEGYRFEVRILGDGAEYDKLKVLLAKHGVEDRVTMYGRVDNPFPYMKRADWFLCPSSRESFALTLLESMSLGTPVITTECGGPEDVIGHGQFGILVENSSEGVYLGMKKVLDDSSLREVYSAKGKDSLSRFNYNGWLLATDQILGV